MNDVIVIFGHATMEERYILRIQAEYVLRMHSFQKSFDINITSYGHRISENNPHIRTLNM